jgi:hypothetical protein
MQRTIEKEFKYVQRLQRNRKRIGINSRGQLFPFPRDDG